MRVTTHRLKNGAGIAVAEMPTVESVCVGVWLGVGGRHEPVRLNGVSHFIEHMLFKGTAKRSARSISEAIEGVGGELNAYTTEEMTCYFAKAAARHFDRLCDVLLDMLFNPALPEDELERERGVIIEEIRMYEDTPSVVVQERLNGLIWQGHALGRPLAGSVENIQRFKRAELATYLRKHYHAGNLWVTVAGKPSAETVVQRLEPMLHGARKQKAVLSDKVPAAQRAPRIEVVKKPIEQSHVALGMRGVSKRDPRRFAVRLLSVILAENMSSRLFQTIREKHGLAYSIYSYPTYLTDTGAFTILAGLDNQKLEKALKLTFSEFRKMAEKPPRLKELKQAKEYTLGQMALNLESPANQMIWLGENLTALGKVPSPQEVTEALEAVSAEHVQSAAADLATDRRLCLAVVSPVAELDLLRELATFGK